MSDVAIAAAVSAVVETDEQVRSRVAGFVNLAISKAEGLMHTGSPDVQVQLIRSVVPVMVKAMAVDGSSDEHAELRTQFEDLMSELRGEVAPVADVSVVEIPVDAPPVEKPKRARKKSS